MSFRKDKSKHLEWSRWLQKNRDVLVDCGLPHDVYEIRESWLYFLEHGGLFAPSRPHWFNISKLSPGQQRKLLSFLQEEFAMAVYPPLILASLKSALGIRPASIECEGKD